MIDGKRVVALIPARGGSKSIPYKNLKLLGDTPLICWPISVALETEQLDRVIVSTDDEKIAGVAKDAGAEIYLRPPHLATDTSIVSDTIRDLWKRLRGEGESAEFLVLLEPTSPFRTPEIIAKCLSRMIDENLDSIATFHEAELNPERAWKIHDGHATPFIPGSVAWKPRQQLTKAYQLNGVVYVTKPDMLTGENISILVGNSGAEIIDQHSAIDIDTERDFIIANAILKS